MGARPAAIRQDDIMRAVRALQAAGLPVVRVVVRKDRVTVETTPEPDRPGEPWELPPEGDGGEIVDL